jgi:hypothetical protein
MLGDLKGFSELIPEHRYPVAWVNNPMSVWYIAFLTNPGFGCGIHFKGVGAGCQPFLLLISLPGVDTYPVLAGHGVDQCALRPTEQ